MADTGTVGRCGLAAGRYEADREIAGAIIRRSDLEKGRRNDDGRIFN